MRVVLRVVSALAITLFLFVSVGCGRSGQVVTVTRTVSSSSPQPPPTSTSSQGTKSSAGLCHGEQSCGGYDHDPSDGQCGRPGQVACAVVPWAHTSRPQRPAALDAEVRNLTDRTSAGPALLSDVADSELLHGCQTPTHGVLIETVVSGGPADTAGLKGSDATLGGYKVGGDVITSVNDMSVPDVMSTSCYQKSRIIGPVTLFRFR